MCKITLDDLGHFVTRNPDHVAKVVMIIKGPSGRQLALFESRSQNPDRQSEAIKNFMEVEAEWQRFQG